jgi:hypothetical protein
VYAVHVWLLEVSTNESGVPLFAGCRYPPTAMHVAMLDGQETPTIPFIDVPAGIGMRPRVQVP